MQIHSKFLVALILALSPIGSFADATPKLIDNLKPLQRLVGKWNWSFTDSESKKEITGVYMLEADPGGYSLVGYIPESGPASETPFFMRFLWYWDPQKELVTCISIDTREGHVGTAVCKQRESSNG